MMNKTVHFAGIRIDEHSYLSLAQKEDVRLARMKKRVSHIKLPPGVEVDIFFKITDKFTGADGKTGDRAVITINGKPSPDMYSRRLFLGGFLDEPVAIWLRRAVKHAQRKFDAMSQ